jgi:hypothetical protein
MQKVLILRTGERVESSLRHLRGSRDLTTGVVPKSAGIPLLTRNSLTTMHRILGVKASSSVCIDSDLIFLLPGLNLLEPNHERKIARRIANEGLSRFPEIIAEEDFACLDGCDSDNTDIRNAGNTPIFNPSTTPRKRDG